MAATAPLVSGPSSAGRAQAGGHQRQWVVTGGGGGGGAAAAPRYLSPTTQSPVPTNAQGDSSDSDSMPHISSSYSPQTRLLCNTRRRRRRLRRLRPLPLFQSPFSAWRCNRTISDRGMRVRRRLHRGSRGHVGLRGLVWVRPCFRWPGPVVLEWHRRGDASASGSWLALLVVVLLLPSDGVRPRRWRWHVHADTRRQRWTVTRSDTGPSQEGYTTLPEYR
jgi:hypothetical protein